jgi:hypothetical protein
LNKSPHTTSFIGGFSYSGRDCEVAWITTLASRY